MKKQTVGKKRTEITKCSDEELLKHPVIQALACGMAAYNDNGFRHIYEDLDYYLSDRTGDIAILESKKVIVMIERDYYNYYSSSKYYVMEPDTMFRVLSAMDEDALQRSFKIVEHLSTYDVRTWDVSFSVRKSFVSALYGYLHSSDGLEQLMKESLPLLNKGLGIMRSAPRMVMMKMMQTPSMHALISKCTRAGLDRFVQVYIDAITDMEGQFSSSLAKGVFFNDENRLNPNVDAGLAIIFVLVGELMMDGHIDRIVEKYSVPDKGPDKRGRLLSDYLSAVKSLHENDPLPMLEVTQRLIGEEGSDILGVPQIGFFAAVAVVMANNLAVIKDYVKILKGIDKENAIMLRSVIDWLQKGNVGPTQVKRIQQSRYYPSTKMLMGFLILHLGMGDVNKGLKEIVEEIRREVDKTCYKYVRLLYLSVEGNDNAALSKMEEETGMTALFGSARKSLPWERALDKISRQLNVALPGKSAKISDTRVAYLISGQHVQPILQKMTATGRWSKGRNIALRTFKAGTSEGMAEQDMKLIPAVRVEESWNGDYYYMDYAEAIFALAGNPCVFTDDDSRLKIDITVQEPQLSVVAGKDGSFKLTTNVNPKFLNDSGIYIDASNPLSYIVMKLSPEKKRLMETLSTTGSLPKEAKPRLADILGALSSQMTVMSDLVSAKDSDVKRVKGWPKIVAQLIPANDLIDVTLYAKPLKDTPPYLTPAEGVEYVNGNFNGKSVQARRNLKAEKKNLDIVKVMLKGLDNSMTGENSWELDIESTLSLLAAITDNSEAVCVEWPEGARMTVSRPTIMPSDLSVKVSDTNNWFEIEGDLKIDDKTVITMAELLRKLRESDGRFIRLEGNDYVALSEHLAKTLKAISRIADLDRKTAGMSAMHVGFMDELEKSGADFKADKNYRNLLSRIEEADTAAIKTPKGIQADLRDYQKEGYRWLQRLYMWGAGACLADDMGLGKTLQTICLLYTNRTKGASLVVAPTSLLLNWRDEITRFAPALNVTVLNDFHDAAKRTETIANAKEGDVVVASYGLLVNLQEAMAEREWNIVTLDEAHTIKNRDTKMSQAAMTLKGGMRVALTGTPLQNRLAEIWNIFQFLNPGLLGSFQAFTDRFIVPIERDSDRGRQRLLKKMLSPFMLRRTKSDVLSELPEKTEITVRVELSEEEHALYENLRREAEIAVESGENSAIQALAEITKLRQAACNARLINPSLHIESSKLRTFMEIVDSLHVNHHRALVFSQFTSHFALVRDRLDKAGVDYLYLDGSTPAAERARLVAQFQNSDIPLFLISLKAGGLGLNLTAADYVVHLDPWWNPAIEDQASDRSHRIGQQKPVTVYRLIAAGTIEEKILRLHSHKKSLADALLEGTDMSARLTRDEILALLSEKD